MYVRAGVLSGEMLHRCVGDDRAVSEGEQADGRRQGEGAPPPIAARSVFAKRHVM